MLRVLFAGIVLAALTPEAAASERCSAVIRDDSGSVQAVELSSFSVESAAAPLALPEQGAGALAIICVRPTLYMSDKDYRVLTDLHLPFAFGDGDRVVWLHVENLRVLMHMDEGELTKEERDQIEAAIVRAQEIMLREGW